MKGKVCVVTGSNSGIGKETTKALASLGATVAMAVRSRERGESARAEIVEASGNEDVHVMVCDVSSKESIAAFVKELESNYDRLDVLVNNAGAVFGRREDSVDGFESTLAVNYLGPFRLTLELLPMLRRGAPLQGRQRQLGDAQDGKDGPRRTPGHGEVQGDGGLRQHEAHGHHLDIRAREAPRGHRSDGERR